MANVKINDLSTASVSSSMQLETDISGTQSNKISISSLTSYMQSNLSFSGLTWNQVSSNTAMVANNGYIVSSGSLVTLTLPTTANIGAVFRVVNFFSGGWRINQNSGQTIYLGIVTTTTGTSGYCASTQFGDCVEIICVNTNLDFMIVSSIGSISFN